MNLRTLGLIALLATLLFITARVLADVKAERIKLKINNTSIEKVEEITGTIEGVIQSNWDEETGELEIVFEQDKTSLHEIEQKISEAGFETSDDNASVEDTVKVTEEIKEYNLPAP